MGFSIEPPCAFAKASGVNEYSTLRTRSSLRLSVLPFFSLLVESRNIVLTDPLRRTLDSMMLLSFLQVREVHADLVSCRLDEVENLHTSDQSHIDPYKVIFHALELFSAAL